jgi:hypothetical protein
VEVCHEPVEAEVVQQVEIHERIMCIMNIWAFLQPYRPASIEQKVSGARL